MHQTDKILCFLHVCIHSCLLVTTIRYCSLQLSLVTRSCFKEITIITKNFPSNAPPKLQLDHLTRYLHSLVALVTRYSYLRNLQITTLSTLCPATDYRKSLTHRDYALSSRARLIVQPLVAQYSSLSTASSRS